MIPKWLEWAKSLQAIAQNGLEYAANEFDIERYKSVMEIAAEILSEHSLVKKEVIKDLFSEQAGYATPRVDVRGIVFKDDKILMVKEKSDGRWTLPGGWADPNEPPSTAVEREVFEESGFIVKASRVLAVYDRDKQGHYPPHPFHVYKLFFLCELQGGKETLSIETSGVEFFSEEEIPELSPARVTIKQIKKFFSKYHTSEWTTEFD